jgi:solute carrier family 15 oligopeptide transporter 1
MSFCSATRGKECRSFWCFSRAARAYFKAQHWLDGAKLNHDPASVEDVKLLFRVLTLFTAFPVFWALFQQQYTKWILQARSMNLEVPWLGGLVLQPEQIQVQQTFLLQ